MAPSTLELPAVNLQAMVAANYNVHWMPRVSLERVQSHTELAVLENIRHDVIQNGVPLLIDKCMQGTQTMSTDQLPTSAGLSRDIACGDRLQTSLPPILRGQYSLVTTLSNGHTPASAYSYGSITLTYVTDTVGSEPDTQQISTTSWFVIPAKDKSAANTYWRDTFHSDLAHGLYLAPCDSLCRAPFEVYVMDTRPGDLVIIPPGSVVQKLQGEIPTSTFTWSIPLDPVFRIGVSFSEPSRLQCLISEQQAPRSLGPSSIDKTELSNSEVDYKTRDGAPSLPEYYVSHRVTEGVDGLRTSAPTSASVTMLSRQNMTVSNQDMTSISRLSRQKSLQWLAMQSKHVPKQVKTQESKMITEQAVNTTQLTFNGFGTPESPQCQPVMQTKHMPISDVHVIDNQKKSNRTPRTSMAPRKTTLNNAHGQPLSTTISTIADWHLGVLQSSTPHYRRHANHRARDTKRHISRATIEVFDNQHNVPQPDWSQADSDHFDQAVSLQVSSPPSARDDQAIHRRHLSRAVEQYNGGLATAQTTRPTPTTAAAAKPVSHQVSALDQDSDDENIDPILQSALRSEGLHSRRPRNMAVSLQDSSKRRRTSK